MPENQSSQLRVWPLVLPRLLAVSLVLVAIRYWSVVRIAVSQPPWTMVGFVSLVFVVLLAAAAAGLFLQRKWGFVAAYLLVLVSTILHSIPLVPFVTDLLPGLDARTWGMVLLNLTFLVATATAHWRMQGGGGSRSGDGDRKPG